MKKEDVSTVTPLTKKERCKGHYKLLWILVTIIILAIVNILTGSLTLKWCAENLTRFSHDFVSSTTLDDLDVLEVDEREKVVRRMWDVYTHRRTTRLPRFWSESFHAAYEHLVSDVPGVRDAAFSEIAKMSLQPLYFPTIHFYFNHTQVSPRPLDKGLINFGRLPLPVLANVSPTYRTTAFGLTWYMAHVQNIQSRKMKLSESSLDYK